MTVPSGYQNLVLTGFSNQSLDKVSPGRLAGVEIGRPFQLMFGQCGQSLDNVQCPLDLQDLILGASSTRALTESSSEWLAGIDLGRQCDRCEWLSEFGLARRHVCLKRRRRSQEHGGLRAGM